MIVWVESVLGFLEARLVGELRSFWFLVCSSFMYAFQLFVNLDCETNSRHSRLTKFSVFDTFDAKHVNQVQYGLDRHLPPIFPAFLCIYTFGCWQISLTYVAP